MSSFHQSVRAVSVRGVGLVAVAAILALALGLASDAWFAGDGVILRRWWPNVGLVLLAFASGGRRVFVPLLIGHSIGLLGGQFLLQEASAWHHLHHVLADMVETIAMLIGLIVIDPGGRLRRSSDLVRAGVLVVLLPPLLSALVYAGGDWLLYGQMPRWRVVDWVAASAGTTAIVLIPWLAWRSDVQDSPHFGLSASVVRARVVGALALAALALALPFISPLRDDALVALLLLIATVRLPVRAAAVLFMLMLATNDFEVSPLLGVAAAEEGSPAWHELRACLIGIAALYVRLLVAESRRAAAAALMERSARAQDFERFQRLLEQVDGIVWEADASTTHFTFVSAGAERLLGYPVEEWLRPGFWAEHMHPEDRIWAPAFCAAQTAAGRPHVFEYRFLHADGSVVWIRDVVSAGYSVGGRASLSGVMIDVTASRAAAAALEHANASLDRLALRHRLALAAGGIGVWEFDPSTGLHLWDDTMFRLFGEEPDTAVPPADLLRSRLAPESLARVRTVVATLREGLDATHSGDYTVVLQNGEKHRLRTVAAITTSAERGRRLVGASWDCSVEYLAAEALRVRADELASVLHTEAMEAVRARTAAERAEATRADLLANVSHELRTPLHAILGFIDLASEDLTDCETENAKQALWKLDRARKAARRLVSQVDELLDLAKLESGAVALRRQRIPLAQLLRSIQEELSAMLVAKGLRIEWMEAGQILGEGGLPAETQCVHVDELRLLQVLRNVLANAVRFSPPGASIRVDASSPDNADDAFVDLAIEDEGPGIPVAQLETIFGKFIQAGQPGREREGGTGLGLPIAREIMRAHGGDLWAEASTRGGRFVLRIPSL
jgi:PAS domain S-box-containing protein